PVIDVDGRPARFRGGKFDESLRPAVHRRQPVGGGTRLRRHHVMIVIPAAGGKASVDQPRTQAVLFARFFRFAFIAHGWLLFRRDPRATVATRLAGEGLRAEPHHSPITLCGRVTRGPQESTRSGNNYVDTSGAKIV